jgi:hypothetical protein
MVLSYGEAGATPVEASNCTDGVTGNIAVSKTVVPGSNPGLCVAVPSSKKLTYSPKGKATVSKQSTTGSIPVYETTAFSTCTAIMVQKRSGRAARLSSVSLTGISYGDAPRTSPVCTTKLGCFRGVTVGVQQ